MTSGTISILGCGWLGVPLAKHFIEKGFTVKGSVTTTEKLGLLSDDGILPCQIVLTHKAAIISDLSFFESDVLIISVPPRRIEGIQEVFPAQIGQLVTFIQKSGIQKVLFISSTSVYPERLQIAHENDTFSPETAIGEALLQAENLLKNQTDFKTTVIRFGGLIGADRNPANFLLKPGLAVANAPINLIHRDDCIGIISAVVAQQLWGETLNACCMAHPSKKDFYGRAAMIFGLPEPVISEHVENYKIVDSSKLINLLNYRFRFPDPMNYLDNMFY